jgi:excisionase family DNA binding protein
MRGCVLSEAVAPLLRRQKKKRPSPPPNARAYTIDQAAEILQASRRTVYRMLAAKTLVALRTEGDKGTFRIPKWSIDRFLAEPEIAEQPGEASS